MVLEEEVLQVAAEVVERRGGDTQWTVVRLLGKERGDLAFISCPFGV